MAQWDHETTQNKSQKRPKVEPSSLIGGSMEPRSSSKIAQKILKKDHKLSHQFSLVAQWDHETTQNNPK
jgi:hypothetical protein